MSAGPSVVETGRHHPLAGWLSAPTVMNHPLLKREAGLPRHVPNLPFQCQSLVLLSLRHGLINTRLELQQLLERHRFKLRARHDENSRRYQGVQRGAQRSSHTRGSRMGGSHLEATCEQ
jgi:hypothetical protein